MCTLLVLTRVWADAPLVVAANRDEALDRPATPPQAGELNGVRIFAPRDLKAGGTWLGVNEHGVFAGLTNRYVPGARPSLISPDRRSRGAVVTDALGARSARDAARLISGLAGDLHNPFHLVVADAAGAWVVWSDGTNNHQQEVAPGALVLTERSFDAAPSERQEQLDALLPGLASVPSPPLDQLRATLSQRRAGSIDAVLVELPQINYGTLSSTLLAYEGARPAHLEFANGAPDRAPWVDFSGAMNKALWG